MRITENLQENFPFISVITHVDKEYVGIIINQDAQVTSMYDYVSIRSEPERTRFLELGEAWWWESNRLIPINLFLKDDWAIFKPYLRTFNNKSLTILHGPTCSISDLNKRRSKRRSITLVKRIT